MKKQTFFDLLTYLFRGLSWFAQYGFIIIALLIAISPITLHIRWSSQYVDHGSYKHFIRCDYLGPRGIIKPGLAPNCPVFAILNTKKWKQ